MFRVLRGGCNTRHPSSFFCTRPNGINNYLILIIKTPAIFAIEEHETKIPPGTAVVMPPHVPYYYSNPNGEYMDDWLHFDFPADAFAIEELLTPGTLFPVSDMELFAPYIRQLVWENTYISAPMRDDNVDHLMYILLNHMSAAFHQRDPADSYNLYQSALQGIRIAMQSSLYNPLSADEVAKQIGISKPHFQHLYTQQFGISFQQDYIQMRINYAKDLLETSSLSLEQIAEICGYSNEVHFYRQFKSCVEMTPARYRKHFHNQM